MAEWRFQRGWSEDELAERLGRLDALERNFAAAETQRERWHFVHSRALIAYGGRGPPDEDDTFLRLWQAVERFEHSDPRIVVVHYRDGAPIAGRRMLLELRALGLRYLCPATVTAERERTGADTTARGLAVDTLDGHIERGREWFVLEKEHASGEIRFQIEASWLPADFPNLWSRVGFHLVGRRYQRAWHRLAHLRLRHLAAGLSPRRPPGAGELAHEGQRLPAAPVQFYAQRHMAPRRLFAGGEEEEA